MNVKMICGIAFLVALAGWSLYLYNEGKVSGRNEQLLEHYAAVEKLESEQMNKLTRIKHKALKERTEREKKIGELQDILRKRPEVTAHDVIKDSKCDDYSNFRGLFEQYHQMSKDISSIGIREIH